MAFLINNNQARIDAMVRAVEDYAHNNVPPSTSISTAAGLSYAGWSIRALLAAASIPVADLIDVEIALQSKYRFAPWQLSSIPPGMLYPQHPPPTPVPPKRPHSLMEMLGMRMGWQYHVYGSFRHIAAFEYDTVVHVWAVTKDNQSVTLDDEAGMYPSDTLITKLRLLEG